MADIFHASLINATTLSKVCSQTKWKILDIPIKSWCIHKSWLWLMIVNPILLVFFIPSSESFTQKFDGRQVNAWNWALQCWLSHGLLQRNLKVAWFYQWNKLPNAAEFELLESLQDFLQVSHACEWERRGWHWIWKSKTWKMLCTF